MAINGLKRLSS